MVKLKGRGHTMSRSVSGIAIAALLAGLYFGAGFGAGEGDGTADSPDTSGAQTGTSSAPSTELGDGRRNDVAGNSETVVSSVGASDLTADASQPTPLQFEVLTVLIDDRSYFVSDPQRPEEFATQIGLEELVGRASQAPGDSSGVRVKVVRRRTARVSAKAELGRALHEAGIPDEAVYWQKQYAD